MAGMKKLHIFTVPWIVVLFGLAFWVNLGFASDMCMFAVTADDLPPNIVILIDNGAEVRHLYFRRQILLGAGFGQPGARHQRSFRGVASGRQKDIQLGD